MITPAVVTRPTLPATPVNQSAASDPTVISDGFVVGPPGPPGIDVRPSAGNIVIVPSVSIRPISELAVVNQAAVWARRDCLGSNLSIRCPRWRSGRWRD